MKTKIRLVAIIFFLSSCTTFRVVPESPYSANSIKQSEVSGKFLVLHRGNEAWHMYDTEIINDSIYAKLDYELGYQIKYLNPDKKGHNRFNRKSEPDVTNALHIYTSDSSFSSLDTLILIPASSIHEVNSYTFNRAAFRASIIIPILFIPIVVLYLIGKRQSDGLRGI